MTGIIKISRSVKELNTKIRKLEEEHLKKTGENISIRELEKALHVNKEDIIIAIDSRNPVESIYKEENKKEDKGLNLIDKISSDENEEKNLIDKLTVNQLIMELEQKEKKIIILRYYRNKTQKQVGEILGISQVQVSRIEKNILNKMKMKLEGA